MHVYTKLYIGNINPTEKEIIITKTNAAQDASSNLTDIVCR